MVRNSVKICTAILLSYLLSTVKAIELEEVCLSDMQILGLFLNTLTADDKYFLVNRDNLTQNIQMEWSKKQKNSSPIFFLQFWNLA